MPGRGPSSTLVAVLRANSISASLHQTELNVLDKLTGIDQAEPTQHLGASRESAAE